MRFQPGDDVVLVSTGECGVIVSCWVDDESRLPDYDVAFFGQAFPAPGTKPPTIPSVLRYAEASLRPAAP